MAVKQVQRYIRLNELVPDLMKLMDVKKAGLYYGGGAFLYRQEEPELYRRRH